MYRTFYSARHDSFSKIDMIWTSEKTGKETQVQIVWDAYKAVMRKNMIYLSKDKKKKQETFQKIQTKIAQ